MILLHTVFKYSTAYGYHSSFVEKDIDPNPVNVRVVLLNVLNHFCELSHYLVKVHKKAFALMP